MEKIEYFVQNIDGEYAILQEVGHGEKELFIALALLPTGIDIGDSLIYENFSYELKE